MVESSSVITLCIIDKLNAVLPCCGPTMMILGGVHK